MSSFFRRAFAAALIMFVLVWQAGFAAPGPVAAEDPPSPPSGFVECGMGFLCDGSTGLPPPGPITVTGPEDRVVQGTYPLEAGFVSPISAWGPIESEAKAYVAGIHQIANDSRVTDWARGELRAYIIARLLDIAEKPVAQRTAQEQTAYETLLHLVQQSKIRSAQNAVDEYNRWHQNPCSYSWPAPLTSAPAYRMRDGVYGPCVDPHLGLITSPVPPTVEEFTAVGSAMEFADLANEPAQMVMDESVAAGVFMAGLGGAAVAATIAAVIIATVPAISSVFVTGGALVIFPYAAFAGSTAASVTAAAGGAGAFVAALGVASAIFIAIIGIVLAGIAIWQISE
jgi:hypothetical protein